MIAPRPWLGISTRDWFKESDTPHVGVDVEPDRELHAPVAGVVLPYQPVDQPMAGAGRIRGDQQPAAIRFGDLGDPVGDSMTR